MRGDREPLAQRIADHLQDPPQLCGGQAARGAVAGGAGQLGDLDGVLALGVRHVRHLPGRAEHRRQPDPDARCVGDRARRPVAVREPVQAAADDDGTGPAGLVHGDAVHVLGGRHLVPAAPRPRAAEPDVEPARYGTGGEVVHQPQVARALVDHPGAVAGGLPGVERVVVGVAAQVGAVVRARVEVAHALVVGEEGDPAGDEHGGFQVPTDVRQQPLPVQPQPAHGAAPVPLPGSRFVRRGTREQQGLVRAVDVGDLDVGDRAPGQLAAGVAVRGDHVGPGEVGERLAVGGDGEDVAVAVLVGGHPAADRGVRAAPVRQLPCGAAVDVDEVDLGHETAPGRVGDVAPVGGEAGRAGLRAVHREPPGAARGVEGGQPEVVLGHEAQQVAAEVREAQIAHLPMLFRGRGPSNSWARGPGTYAEPTAVRQDTYETVSFRWILRYLHTRTEPCRSKQEG